MSSPAERFTHAGGELGLQIRDQEDRETMQKSIAGLVPCILASMIGATAHAQPNGSTLAAKNEVGLVIGATETPSVALQRGRSVNLNSSLALGIEYDRLLLGRRTAIYGGVDFLASPFDVKVSFPAADISPEYAYLFLMPHVRVKFNADRSIEPWLLFGGGYADFSPAQPEQAM